MNDKTFLLALVVIAVVYATLPLLLPVSENHSFTFDLGEIVCMAISLAYLYEAVNTKRGIRPRELKSMFRNRCILYAAAGIALKILGSFSFA
ncbi:MAG: hypothetical protein F6K04_23515 [Leptolyngbya sp. SIO4C5]|nr:hypothetical protein [Leptolyngbya sp. SIO4C5]